MESSLQPGARRLLGVAIFCALLTATVRAHGGIYRGPGSGGPPGGGVPGNPSGPAGPTTPGGGGGPTGSETSWNYWWEFNRDRFLLLRAAVQGPAPNPAGPAAGGQTQSLPTAIRRALAPTAEQLDDRVIPALDLLMRQSSQRDVTTAGAMALAKIGRLHDRVDVPARLLELLRRGNQEVRETGALSLGVSGLDAVLEPLFDLARNTPAGRRLVDDDRVDDRTRAFAIYGLGVFAEACGSEVQRERVLDVLEPLLADRRLDDRDLQVALVHSIAMTVFEATTSTARRTRWRALRALEEFADRKLGRGSAMLQAHVPTAMARVLGRGNSSDHRRLRDEWIEAIDPRTREHITVQQSIVLALGELCLPPESGEGPAAATAALRTYLKRGPDEQARRFCLIALARIGGPDNRTFLMEQWRKAGKGTDKPWAALALGLLAWEDRQRTGNVDQLIGKQLLRGVRDIESPEHRGAAALALGLIGYLPAAPELRRLLRKLSKRDQVAGYLAMGLALMQDVEGKELIRKVLRESSRRPRLLAQCAVALAIYGDLDASEELLRMMRRGEVNLARLAAIAGAFRFVGDRRVVDPLVDGVLDKDHDNLSRAFLAAALGGVCARRELPWNEPIARNTNYLANVPTLRDGLNGILDIL